MLLSNFNTPTGAELVAKLSASWVTYLKFRPDFLESTGHDWQTRTIGDGELPIEGRGPRPWSVADRFMMSILLWSAAGRLD